MLLSRGLGNFSIVPPRPNTLSSLQIRMHLGSGSVPHGYTPPAGCDTGISPAAGGLGPINQDRGQRTLNRGLSRQDAAFAAGTLFREGKQKVYASWCHSPGNVSQETGETTNPCCIHWPEPLINPVSYPRTKRLFLRGPSADGPIQDAYPKILTGVSLALNLEICLLAFCKVLLHALNLTWHAAGNHAPAESSARHFSSTNPHQPSSPVVISGNFVCSVPRAPYCS
jgi:hypothetical protein